MPNRQTIALGKIIQERGIEVSELLLQQFSCKRNLILNISLMRF